MAQVTRRGFLGAAAAAAASAALPDLEASPRARGDGSPPATVRITDAFFDPDAWPSRFVITAIGIGGFKVIGTMLQSGELVLEHEGQP